MIVTLAVSLGSWLGDALPQLPIGEIFTIDALQLLTLFGLGVFLCYQAFKIERLKESKGNLQEKVWSLETDLDVERSEHKRYKKRLRKRWKKLKSSIGAFEVMLKALLPIEKKEPGE